MQPPTGENQNQPILSPMKRQLSWLWQWVNKHWQWIKLHKKEIAVATVVVGMLQFLTLLLSWGGLFLLFSLLLFVLVIILLFVYGLEDDNFFLSASGFLVFISVELLLLWLVVNLAWPADAFLQKEMLYADTEQDFTVRVYYPSLLLANSESRNLNFVVEKVIPTLTNTPTPDPSITLEPTPSLTNTPPPTSTPQLNGAVEISDETPPATVPSPTMTSVVLNCAVQDENATRKVEIIIELPEGIEFSEYPLVKKTAVAFDDELFQQSGICIQSLSIKNSRAIKSELRPRVNPTLIFSPTLTNESKSITLTAEGEWGYTFRTFINSTINERSPLIILATGLLSGAGFMFKEYLERDEKKREKRREDQAMLQIEIEDMIEKFNKQLINEDRESAGKILVDLLRKYQEWSDYEETRYGD